jgi:hypothetical protein
MLIEEIGNGIKEIRKRLIHIKNLEKKFNMVKKRKKIYLISKLKREKSLQNLK